MLFPVEGKLSQNKINCKIKSIPDASQYFVVHLEIGLDQLKTYQRNLI